MRNWERVASAAMTLMMGAIALFLLSVSVVNFVAAWQMLTGSA